MTNIFYFIISDEERQVTALDKFVIHNATSSKVESKKKTEKSSTKGSHVSVADFFGTSITPRVERKVVPANKRKREEEKV